MRREKREVADDLASSREEKREKQAMVASLQDRVSGKEEEEEE